MATWDAILSHYSFDSKNYSEISDLADISKAFVDVEPEYPIPAFRPNSNLFLHQAYHHDLSPILTNTNTLYDFIKMHMHKAWLLGKSDLTIELPSDYFTVSKYLFVFCGTLTLNQICDNRDANTFDIHSFLFATSHLMIWDSFMLQMLRGSGSMSFHLNSTILPALYALLNLEFDFPRSQTWFESRFKFYNHDFVCSIKNLPCHAFRHRFLYFECHNERYQEHCFNDFLGRVHCTSSCDICIEHDSIHYLQINLELFHFKVSSFNKADDSSKFRPFTRTYKQDDQLFPNFTPAVLYQKCTTSCILPIIKKQHFYTFTYQSMLIYAYYNNLTPTDKAFFVKCH